MKPGGAHAMRVAERQRQQQQRPAFSVIGDDDERTKTLALAGVALPGAQKVEALIGGGKLRRGFEGAPDRLGRAEIAENVHAGDAA